MATATDALNAASAGIEDIPEESRNDTGQQVWSLERQRSVTTDDWLPITLIC